MPDYYSYYATSTNYYATTNTTNGFTATSTDYYAWFYGDRTYLDLNTDNALRQQREADEVLSETEYNRIQKKEEIANERALKLLKSSLTSLQLKRFEQDERMS